MDPGQRKGGVQQALPLGCWAWLCSPNQISPTQPTVAEEVFTVGADFTAAVSTVPDLADFTAMPSTAGDLTAVSPVCTAVLAMAAGAAGTMAGMAGATAGG